MIGTIVKLAILAVVILVALNIFAPNQADKILSSVSDKTGMDKGDLSDKLNNATEFTKDTIKEASDTVQDKVNN
ncbi:MAG: hypothetical protein U9N59_00680 [Campylobacterota bacterium]|nr:hypothetical protein [Campylobacterota bacterium]